MRLVLLVAASHAFVACASEKTSASECEAIQREIDDLAAKRGIASQGVCSNPSPLVQQDFGDKCRRLEDCRAHCCED